MVGASAHGVELKVCDPVVDFDNREAKCVRSIEWIRSSNELLEVSESVAIKIVAWFNVGEGSQATRGVGINQVLLPGVGQAIVSAAGSKRKVDSNRGARQPGRPVGSLH